MHVLWSRWTWYLCRETRARVESMGASSTTPASVVARASVRVRARTSLVNRFSSSFAARCRRARRGEGDRGDVRASRGAREGGTRCVLTISRRCDGERARRGRARRPRSGGGASGGGGGARGRARGCWWWTTRRCARADRQVMAAGTPRGKHAESRWRSRAVCEGREMG